MVVNEIFYSLQGEGLLAGVPSVFIRLAGCPLRCGWCDTKYAWDASAGENLTIERIVEKVEGWRCGFTVITGGEPMINPQLPQLAALLKKNIRHITIETAGIEFVADIACDLMSISPKLSNSGMKRVPDSFSAIKQLMRHYVYQLKFVVDSPRDLSEIQETVGKLGNVDVTRVLLMPQARTREELIAKAPMVAQLCRQSGYTFSNRLQVLLYDGARGK